MTIILYIFIVFTAIGVTLFFYELYLFFFDRENFEKRVFFVIRKGSDPPKEKMNPKERLYMGYPIFFAFCIIMFLSYAQG